MLKWLGACLVAALSAFPALAQDLTPEEARSIAREATIYGFPLVDNYRIQHSYFVDRDSPEYKAPWNTIHNVARVFTPEDKAIQTPNSDTPYSQLGADLRAEPLVIHVPEAADGRYYSLQFIDQYTYNFAYLGSRASGGKAGAFLLAGPRWSGETPAGIQSVLRSETDFAFILYRTQLFGPDDIDGVKAVQAQYRVQPLSAYLGQPAPAAPAAIDYPQPLSPEDQRTSPEFFELVNFVLQFAPPHPSETELLARFARLGIGGGERFDFAALSPEIQASVRAGMADAWAEFAQFKTNEVDTGKRPPSEAFGTREFIKNDYMTRMSAAVLGIYGNSKEEALYPPYFVDAKGEPLDGTKRYRLRLTADAMPPVNSFWSLTVYELPSSLLYANPLDRYLINTPMLDDLKRDADGSIPLFLQHETPGAEWESNWLPVPAGPFWTTLRLYWPKAEALDGRWTQPPLELVAAEEKAAETTPAPATEPSSVPVTVENFARAESDLYFGGVVRKGGFGRFDHTREVAPVDDQTVIRLNRDTLYSAGVFDLDAGPVTITLPDPGDRFLSMQVISEDQYTPQVIYEPGAHTLTREAIGTRYVLAAIRILVDPNDAEDVARVHALQDAVTVKQASPGRFEVPQWDPVSQKRMRDALVTLADTLPDRNRMFGRKDAVDPVRFLLGAASAWGGNPDRDAVYLNVFPPRNDGETIYRMKVGDVPVDSFWSISVYNAEGYYQPNPLDAYTLNSITAAKDADGGVAVQFGGCDGKMANCLPIMKGWNYMVRLYRPRAEILDGSWQFPEAVPAP